MTPTENESESGRGPLAAYATLVRLPNLFTAPPDVVLGAALAAGAGGSVAPATVTGLAVASILLYAAGTTLNDYFDADEDARERPERPIPSGDVSRRAALAFGSTLILGGVVVAFVSGGPESGAVAALVAALVVLYDGAFKGGPLGFLFVGGARGSNVLLGATAGVGLSLPPLDLAVPLVILGYIAAVTYMAEGETEGGNRGAVVVAAAGAVVAALAVLVRAYLAAWGPVETAIAVGLTVVFLAWTGRPLRRAYADPVPGTVGPAVGACVLGLVVLDAAFAATVGYGWALVALVFLVPARGLSRVFDVT